MKVLVTGARGFIGRHVVEALTQRKHEVFSASKQTSSEQVRGWALQAHVIVHLAGANRPVEESQFAAVNRDLTIQLANWLRESSLHPTVVFSSSSQAELENPYGLSK